MSTTPARHAPLSKARTTLLAAMLCLGVAAGFAPSTALADAEKPNVLFIAVDDLRPQTAAHGDETVQTPHMDRLANSGRLFLHHHVQVPTCGASRYSLLSGQYPKRPPSLGNHAFNLYQQGHAPPSLPEWFRKHGYHTMQTGKISHSPDGFRDDRERIAASGVENTYSRAPHLHFTNPEDPEVPGAWDAFDTPVGQWGTAWGAFFAYADGVTRVSGESPAIESHDTTDEGYPDGLLADTAVAALTSLRDRGEPFFYAVGFYKPHLPFAAPQKYWDLYDPEQFDVSGLPLLRRRGGELFAGYSITPGDLQDDGSTARELIHGYHAVVSYVDAQIGRVLDALDELGLTGNTIVVLWGDHGFHLGELGFWGKHTLHESSLASAFMMRVPGIAQPGHPTEAVIGSIDIYPTLVELAGLPMPDHLDGTSFAETLRNPDADPVGFSAGFWGDRYTIRTSTHRLIDNLQDNSALFDHRNDPGETENIAEQHPETTVKLQGKIRELLERRKAR